jgi:16S rRNA processing protein RimM
MVDVGRIVGVFGLQGMVKVSPFTDFPERFAKGSKLYLDGIEFKVQSCHWYKQQVRVKLAGIDKIEQAEPLRGKVLQFPQDERPDLPDDQFYATDLIGLRVVDATRGDIGTISDVEALPDQDLLLIGETIIPAIREFVLEIDLDTGVVRVDLPEGMAPGEEWEEAR